MIHVLRRKFFHRNVLINPSRTCWMTALVILCLNICLLFPADAQLIVTPTRVELSEKTRTSDVTIISQSKERVTYRVSWIQFSMQEDGSYKETEQPRADAKSLEGLIRFSPRQVTLEPGETQTVRLSLSRNASLPEGELRSHLVFRADPTPFAQSDSGTEGVSINLAVAKGVAIPILYRKGALSTSVSLDNPQLIKRPDQQALSIVIKREGSASPFGDLEVIGTVDGKEKTLGQIKGVAVFLEITQRRVQIPLSDPTEFEKAKKVRILYYQTSAQGQRSKLLAETSLP